MDVLALRCSRTVLIFLIFSIPSGVSHILRFCELCARVDLCVLWDARVIWPGEEAIAIEPGNLPFTARTSWPLGCRCSSPAATCSLIHCPLVRSCAEPHGISPSFRFAFFARTRWRLSCRTSTCAGVVATSRYRRLAIDDAVSFRLTLELFIVLYGYWRNHSGTGAHFSMKTLRR